MTEADVGVPACAVDLNSEDEVGPRPRAAWDRADPYSGEEHLDLRAERLERRLQQQVLLEAISAAAVGHELLLEVLGLERDRDATPRVEVLERDRGDMRAVKLGQIRAPAQPDAGEIRVEVEHPPTVLRPARAVREVVSSAAPNCGCTTAGISANATGSAPQLGIRLE